MKSKNEIIKLKPLCEIPLSTQLSNITGDGWNALDYSSPDGVIYDKIITHNKTQKRFLLVSKEIEDKAYIELRNKRKKEAEEEKIRLSHKYDNHPNIIIDYNNPERWRKGLNHCLEGNITEMCESSYWNFLESVPPCIMNGNSYVSGEPHHHNKDGQPVYLCGIQRGEKFYAQYGTVNQFRTRELFKGIK